MGSSAAVHELVACVLRGRPPDGETWRRAFEAPPPIWHRVLGFEGCAPQLDWALREQSLADRMPVALREMLRNATSTALRLGLIAHSQLAEIAAIASASNIRVMALKGAAQLLGGRIPAARSISDIDLLVHPEDADRLHALLRENLRYASSGQGYEHHLPVLDRRGSLSIDLHVQLADAPSDLDRAMWSATRVVNAGAHPIELPSETNMVLHTLEHGITLNWMGRYRLRDVLDIASLYTAAVSHEAVQSYVARSGAEEACEILLSAAHALEPRVPRFRGDAWSTIRRVARVRLALAALPSSPRVAERCFRYGGLVAEASPRSMIRAGRLAMRRLVAVCAHAVANA